MAPSFECAVVSSLLCAEDDSVFDDNSIYEATSFLRNRRTDNHRGRSFYGGDGDGIAPPFSDSEEGLSSLIYKESEHLPRDDYLKRLRSGDLDVVARAEAIDWICKVHAHFGFGPLCAFLSVNYMDRFLSSYELSGKAQIMHLLAVACLSLAAKMEETDVPLSLDLQVGESKFVFDARTIQRMELLVLSTLKWRMQAVTPFSFLDHFHSKINVDQSLRRFTILRSCQLISNTLKGIHFLEFKPSELAAAVVISSAEEQLHVALDSEKALSNLSPYVSKARLLKCKELIKGQGLTGSWSLQCAPQSPNGVLEAACLSFRSDESSLVGSQDSSPVPKRRRLDRSCENRRCN
ncbi:PREDICTED: cyclin-D4-1-like isoform X2 [Tarenaya hassleriana]|uniref:cyclin-D4-1-like isoform X2 n=1 Tax=Tarenaya hassleriana TaxID=28532 RepID=UPI00053C2E59|nr:PREDICTED: cyclin-D4-1-like isoform X2 [Tarenaya hassleriana]